MIKCIKAITSPVDGTLAKVGSIWTIEETELYPKTFYNNNASNWYVIYCKETNVRLDIREDIFHDYFKAI